MVQKLLLLKCYRYTEKSTLFEANKISGYNPQVCSKWKGVWLAVSTGTLNKNDNKTYRTDVVTSLTFEFNYDIYVLCI